MDDEKKMTAETPEKAAEPIAETAEAPATAVAEPAEAPATAAEVAEKDGGGVKDAVLTGLGVVLCLILAPILVANITMIVRSYTDPDNVPSFGGYVPFIVMTDSMKGTIDGGDLVIDKVVTDPAQIKPGDIISFFDPASVSDSIVTHRVIEVVSSSDGLSFRTKGDANNDADTEPVPAEKVVGLYKTRLSGMGNVVMFLQSTPGLVICIALPRDPFVGMFDIVCRTDLRLS